MESKFTLIGDIFSVSFLLGYLILFILPGYLFLYQVGIRKTSAVIPLSTAISLGILPIIALCLSWLRIPFRLESYFVSVSVFLLISILFLRRYGTECAHKQISFWQSPIWPSMVLGLFLLYSFAAFTLPAHIHDGSFHGLLTQRIFETKSVLPDVTNGSVYTPPLNGKMYPFSIHAASSLLMQCTGLASYKAVFYFILILVAMTPIVFHWVVYLITDNTRFAIVASWFCIPLLIYRPFGWGGYPQWGGIILLFLLLAVLLKILESKSTVWTLVGILILSSVFYVHMTEIITFIVISVPLVWSKLSQLNKLERSTRIKRLSTLVIGFLTILLPCYSLLFNQFQSTSQYVSNTPEQQSFLKTLLVFGWELFGKHQAFIWIIFFIIGILLAIKQKQLRWLLMAQLMLIILYAWVSMYPNSVIRYVAFVYYNTAERILYVQPVFTIVFCSIGYVFVLDWLKHNGKLVIRKIVIAATVINFIWSLVCIEKELQSYKENSVVDLQAFQAIEWIGSNMDRSAVFLNDLDDGSYWIPSIAGNPTLLNHSQQKSADYSDRIYLLNHAQLAGKDAKVTELLTRFRISYVFYNDKLLPNGKHLLNRELLRSNTHWQEVYRSNETSIFAYKKE